MVLSELYDSQGKVVPSRACLPPANSDVQHPPRKPPPSFLSPLIHQVDNAIPTEFQLPEDVRTFFKDGAYSVH